jgi:YVTN family beta-propeller protein
MNSRDLRALTVRFLVTCFLGYGHALAQNAYIPNFEDNTVSVINTQTNTVTATIPAGTAPYGVAVGHDKAYVTNSDGVSVIDIATNTVVTTISVEGYPAGVAVTPDESKVYVVGTGEGQNVACPRTGYDYGYGCLAVIDTATETVTNEISCFRCRGIAISPDGSKLYANTVDFGTALVYDTTTNNLIGYLPYPDLDRYGYGFFGIAASLDGKRVYLTNSGDPFPQPTADVFNAVTDKEIATIPLPFYSGTGSPAVSPGSAKWYVPVPSTNTLWVMAAPTNGLIAEIPVGHYPGSVAQSAAGAVYVTNYDDNTVSVIDPVSQSVVATILVGNGPFAFGNFIQPGPLFAGTLGQRNCVRVSLATLTTRWGGPVAAAAALGYRNYGALRTAIRAYCSPSETVASRTPPYSAIEVAKFEH